MRLTALSLAVILFLCMASFGQENSVATAEIAAHQLQVTLTPETNTLHALDNVTLTEPVTGEFSFTLNKNLTVLDLSVEGLVIDFETMPYEGPGAGETGVTETFQTVKADFPMPVETFSLTYEGIINDPINPSTALGRVRGDMTTGIISPGGIYMSSETGWYPDTSSAMPTFEITVFCPEDWLAVTQGDLLWRDSGTSYWMSEIPSDGCVLVANKYFINSRDIDGVVCSTYFYGDNPELAASFLDKLEEYLPAYVELFGPFPYTRFDVVENFFTTGYGMPGFTLLGSRVLTMPYATAEGSLAHELVHCWWGNYVVPDWDHGNWCEGLTYFSTNYYWNVLKGDEEAVRDFRFRDMLRYTVEVGPDADYPVRQFRTKTSEIDGDIGYSKAGAIFGMLMTMLGEEKFFEGLRKVLEMHGGQHATWDDFRDCFESVSDTELDEFFTSWLDKTGAPELEVSSIDQWEPGEGPYSGLSEQGAYSFHFEIQQTGEFFYFELPIRINTASGYLLIATNMSIDPSFMYMSILDSTINHESVMFGAPSTGPNMTFITVLLFEPVTSLELDPDYHVFRRLDRTEIPPSLNVTMNADRLLIVIPSGGESDTLQIMDYTVMPPAMKDVSVRELCQDLADSIMTDGEGITVKTDAEVTEEDLNSSSILCLGAPGYNSLAMSLANQPGSGVELSDDGFTVDGVEYTGEGNAVLVSTRNPFNSAYDVTFYLGNSPDAIFKASLIFFYGWDSYVVYDAGNPVARGQWDMGRGPWFVEIGE